MVLLWVPHKTEEKWMCSGARKRVLEQAVGASQGFRGLADGIFVQATGTLSQTPGGDPSPPTWAAPAPGALLPRAAAASRWLPAPSVDSHKGRAGSPAPGP